MSSMFYIFIFSTLGVTSARYNFVPKFYAQDSAIIVDADQPPSSSQPQKLLNSKSQSATLPYYQPIQTIPAYKIFSKTKSKNDTLSWKNEGYQTSPMSPSAAIFTQEEFPRDLLEIAQQKLGLKTIDEVPSITELAELLGTNSVAETISYIRQLTSTEQGIALMKAYIESSDYTDSVGNRNNEIIATDDEAISSTTISPQLIETENATSLSFFQRIAAFLSSYNVQPQQKQDLLRMKPEPTPSPYRNLRPLYVRNPLPYHYPVPLRPIPLNRSNYNAMQMYMGRPVLPTKIPKTSASIHLNTLKSLTPAHIQQLARMANIQPSTLKSFLQRKPKLAELAAKVASYPITRENGMNGQLLAAVHKAIENDEDLKKLLNTSDTLK